MPRSRCYSELKKFKTFEERFEYLSLDGSVGESTFGFRRWLNQHFYTSYSWKQVRNVVILRDDGCDLGIPGYEIHSEILIHHMNPVTERAILDREEWLLDPEYLITTTKRTHNAIHYGDGNQIHRPFVPRQSGDTKLW